MRYRSSSRSGSVARRSVALVPLDPQALTRKLLSNVSANDINLLEPSFATGMAEALVVIRRRKKTSKALIKSSIRHFAGTDVDDFEDKYYLLRVWVPENDPGGAILFVFRIQRPDTGEFIVAGAEYVIPVRCIVGVGAHSISDGHPVKHFKLNHSLHSQATGRTRVLASFVQGQVALDIMVDTTTIDAQLKRKNITQITSDRKGSESLQNGQLILCFESMEERNTWLDFLTNLLMDVETADLRLEELKSRRRNKTIGPTGAVTASDNSLLSASDLSRMPPPPNPTGISPDDIARYRMFHFKAGSSNEAGGQKSDNLGNVVVGPSHTLGHPPIPGGELNCRLRGETEFSFKKITSKHHATLIVGAGSNVQKTLDLSSVVIQATIPYSEPFHIIKIPHDAASASEERQNGGPVKLLECRARDPAERQLWIEWMIFVKGSPQSEDDTYTYREMEKKIEMEKKFKEIEDEVGDNTATTQSQLKQKAQNLKHLAALNTQNGGGKAGSKGDKKSDDRSSATSIGSHVFSKTKKLVGGPAHDAWREFTFGHEEEIVIDAKGMKDLLYDTSIDWGLPKHMMPLPVDYNNDEQLKMSRKKEENNQQRRLQQLLAMQLAEREQQQKEAEMRHEKMQNEQTLGQYSDGVAENNNNNSTNQNSNNNTSLQDFYNTSVDLEAFKNSVQNQYYTSSPVWGAARSPGGGGGFQDQFNLSSNSNNNIVGFSASSILAPSGNEFVTRGCWAYVQLCAQGMPPMVDEAAFALRYFFATFGGCFQDQRAGLGRILVLNGDDLSQVWYNCTIDDVVGYQVGSRAGGPLSFVLRIRDTHSGGAVLRMTVVCSCVMDRSAMIQFLQQAGGIEQIPATLISDLRDGTTRHDFIGRKVSRRPIATPNTVFDLIETHIRDGGVNGEAVDDIDPQEAMIARNQFEQQQQYKEQRDSQSTTRERMRSLMQDQQQQERGESVSSSHDDSTTLLSSSPSGTSTSEFFASPNNNKQIPQSQQQQQQQRDKYGRIINAANNTSLIGGRPPMTLHPSAIASSGPPNIITTAPSSPNTKKQNKNKNTTSTSTHRKKKHTSKNHQNDDSDNDENDIDDFEYDKNSEDAAREFYRMHGEGDEHHQHFTLGRLSTEHASPHPGVVPDSYALMTITSDQPTACQLCGTTNKAESALCKATGLFHPEFLAARATERQMMSSAQRKQREDSHEVDESDSFDNVFSTANDNSNTNNSEATSILHFMPPMQVIPRQDVSIAFRRFLDASKKSDEVPRYLKLKRDSEKLSFAVLERYSEECKMLAEEAELHLFAASVEGYGPNATANASAKKNNNVNPRNVNQIENAETTSSSLKIRQKAPSFYADGTRTNNLFDIVNAVVNANK